MMCLNKFNMSSKNLWQMKESPTPLKKNINSDLNFLPISIKNQPKSTVKMLTFKSDTIPFLIGHQKSIKGCSGSSSQAKTRMKPRSSLSFQQKSCQPLQTGDRRERSTTSRTKVNAVHAGPSQPLAQSKVLTSLKLVSSQTFRNNSWQIVTKLQRDAMGACKSLQ